MSSSPAPWWARSIGVITMIDTMVVWVTATVSRASRARGEAFTASNPARSERPSRVCSAGEASDRAVSSGSGRRNTAIRAPVSRKTAPAQTKGPAVSGMEVPAKLRLAGADRLGPSTAPMVEAHTTREIARARWSGAARSAAANRDWRLAEEAAPKAAMPSSSSGKFPIAAATTTRPAADRADRVGQDQPRPAARARSSGRRAGARPRRCR